MKSFLQGMLIKISSISLIMLTSSNSNAAGSSLIDGFADMRNQTEVIAQCHKEVQNTGDAGHECVKRVTLEARAIVDRLNAAKYGSAKLVLLQGEMQIMTNAIVSMNETVAALKDSGGKIPIKVFNDRLDQLRYAVNECSIYLREGCDNAVDAELASIKAGLKSNGYAWIDTDAYLRGEVKFNYHRLNAKLGR